MDNFLKWLLKASNFLTSILFLLMGTVVLVYGGYRSILALATIFEKSEMESKIISEVLKGLDLVFLGMIIQMLAIGVYELFVSPIKNLPDWLTITKFDQLKGLLVKASITVVTISFVGKAVTWNGETEIMNYGIGIGIIIASLSYFIKIKEDK